MQNTIVKNKSGQEETKPFEAQGKGVWKSVIEELTDPASGMSEEEIKEYEAKITSKLKRGKKLTAKEMDFLRVHNPELYRSALRVKLRKEQLEQQLKNCRSKSEAAEVARRAVATISSEDPDKEFMVAGLSETMRQFKKSSAYARLPQTEEPENGRRKRKRAANFEEKTEDEEKGIITPIQEVLDEMPTFDVVQ